MRSRFGTLSSGAVVEETGDCNCAYPDLGDYSVHEPHCGFELIGFLPEEAAVMHGFDPYPEPTLMGSMLWDFGGIGMRGHEKAPSPLKPTEPESQLLTLDEAIACGSFRISDGTTFFRACDGNWAVMFSDMNPIPLTGGTDIEQWAWFDHLISTGHHLEFFSVAITDCLRNFGVAPRDREQ